MAVSRDCIKANFSGYYVLKKNRGLGKVGTSDFYRISEWKRIELTDVEKVSDYDSETQKLGNYLYYPDLENLTVKVPDGVIENQRLYDVLLKDVEITFILDENNEKWVKAKGVFYGSLVDVKKQPAKKKEPPVEKEPLDASKSVEYEQIKEERTIEQDPVVETTGSAELGTKETTVVGTDNGGCGSSLQRWTTPKKGSWLGRMNDRFNSSRMNRANRN